MITAFIVLLILTIILVVLSYISTLYNCFKRVYIAEGNRNDKTIKEYKQAPGPVPWPIIGNLALLAKYNFPFQGFTELSHQMGDIYTLTLGTRRCLVVNSLELIREVLNQKGKFFGGRPNFLRYHKLFGGDRNNSLALCDWSSLQQKRRNLARRHCSPRSSSLYFTKMSNVGCFEMSELMTLLKCKIELDAEIHIKPLIQQTCANMFLQYMCSIRFEYDDSDFKKVVEYFDEIFWEINQGYALDFLPWLAPFYKEQLEKTMKWSTTIRQFILDRIINEREQILNINEPENDFTDALLKSLTEDYDVSRDTIIFMLEDFIGGHSAIGNLVMIALARIAHDKDIGKNIQLEADLISDNGTRPINLFDMDRMPYTMATIMEVLRFSSSPIVPHVATEDTVVADYGVTKGTIVFINNYKLNRTTQYWQDPHIFQPERFLDTVSTTTPSVKKQTTKLSRRRNSEGSDSGVEFEKEELHTSTANRSSTDLSNTNTSPNSNQMVQLKKNIPHFLPFSIGKRTCIGQNLVRGFGFILLANILQQFDVGSNDLSKVTTIPACVALPTKTFPLTLTPRKVCCEPSTILQS